MVLGLPEVDPRSAVAHNRTTITREPDVCIAFRTLIWQRLFVESSEHGTKKSRLLCARNFGHKVGMQGRGTATVSD